MRIGTLAVMALLAAGPAAVAQDVSIQGHSDQPSVRVFRNYTLPAGETAQQVVVVGG